MRQVVLIKLIDVLLELRQRVGSRPALKLVELLELVEVRGGAVVAGRTIVRWHEGTHVAHHEDLARPGACQEIGHQARIGAADEEDVWMLAVFRERLEPAFDGGEGVVVKPAQALQQIVGHVDAG